MLHRNRRYQTKFSTVPFRLMSMLFNLKRLQSKCLRELNGEQPSKTALKFKPPIYIMAYTIIWPICVFPFLPRCRQTFPPKKHLPEKCRVDACQPSWNIIFPRSSSSLGAVVWSCYYCFRRILLSEREPISPSTAKTLDWKEPAEPETHRQIRKNKWKVVAEKSNHEMFFPSHRDFSSGSAQQSRQRTPLARICFTM